MRYVIRFLFALLCIAVAGLTFLLIAPPTGMLRDQVVAAVKDKTGRTLTINGQASLHVFPALAVSFADVALANPAAMEDGHLVRMERLEVAIRLLPLMRRVVAVDKLVLVRPVFELRRDAHGRRNWDLERPLQRHGLRPASPVRLAAAPDSALTPRSDAPPALRVAASDPASAPEATVAALDGLSLGDVRIIDGTLTYIDERAGLRRTLSGIDATVTLPDLSQPLGLDASVAIEGQRHQLALRVMQPSQLLAARQSDVSATLAGTRLEARFEGQLALTPQPRLAGKLDARAPSARLLAETLGVVLGDAPGLGAVAVSGNVLATVTGISLAGALITLDDTTAQGDLAVDLAHGRPLLKGELAFARLDLNRVLGNAVKAPPSARTPAPVERRATLPPEPPGPTPPGPAPRVRGWSSAPLNLVALRALDADLRVRAQELVVQDLKAEKTRIALTLRGGVLKAAIEDTQLYQGRGVGEVLLDASTGVPQLALRFTLDGVDGRALLQALAGFDRLSGRGKLVLDVKGRGADEQAIAHSLAGSADLKFTDGALVGVNIAQMLRGLQKAQFTGLTDSESEKTDFSELAATFTIANGVATTNDLRLLSPLLRVTGTGTVDLGRRLLDLGLKPRLVATLAGQGGDANASGFEIPLQIQGPWDKPRYLIDTEALLKNPANIERGVRQIENAIKGKSLDDAKKTLKGLFQR